MPGEFTSRVEVQGLKEFQKDLRSYGAEYPKALQRLNKSAAEEVADAAGNAYESLHGGGTGRTRRRGIRANATQTSAAVILGGSGVPQIFGQEFGSAKLPQFPAWSGRGAEAGYFFYPAVRAEVPKLRETYLDALVDTAHTAFPERG